MIDLCRKSKLSVLGVKKAGVKRNDEGVRGDSVRFSTINYNRACREWRGGGGAVYQKHNPEAVVPELTERDSDFCVSRCRGKSVRLLLAFLVYASSRIAHFHYLEFKYARRCRGGRRAKWVTDIGNRKPYGMSKSRICLYFNNRAVRFSADSNFSCYSKRSNF